MKKLNVDTSMCIGCGICASICENNFTISDANGLSEVISQENIESPEVQQTVDSCPVGAISIIDDSQEKND